jgi:hypothetical protein
MDLSMSFEQQIDLLQNRLISLFATLDSWCDHCSMTQQQNDNRQSGNFRQVLLEVLTLNQYVIAHTSRSQTGTVCTFTDPQIFEVAYHRLPEILRLDLANRFHGQSAEFIRKEIREQLFHFLCLLDEPASMTFSARSILANAPALDGAAAIDMVNKYISGYIRSNSPVETDLI